MQFEPNEGQANSRVKFLSRGRGYSLFLTSNEAVLSLRRSASGSSKAGSATGRAANKPQADRAVIQMALEGANPNPTMAGQDPLPGHVNYFIGNDRSKWHTDIPTYSQVAYQSVYPGIDEAFYGNQRQLEYDFNVAPGADASRIAMRVEGAERVSLQSDGSVRLVAGDGAMQLRAPVVYQGTSALRKVIAANYELTGGNEIRFRIGAYDHSQPLVIDPMLVYSTFLGGSGADDILAARIDTSGNFYVTGYTFSDDFPLVKSLQSNTEFPNGNEIAFISELAAAGNNLVFSTYLGGSGVLSSSGGTGDEAEGIALNPSNGDVLVAGDTFSVDFPVTATAYQTLNGGASVGLFTSFLTVLNAGGNGLVYSTYLGGNNGDGAFAVAADSAGNAYIGGATASVNFPIIPGAPEPTYVSSSTLFEGFLSKINTTLSGTASLTYSTFIGGTGDSGTGDGDEVFSVHTDGNGNAFFGGHTSSVDFLTTAGITTAFQLTCTACSNGGYNGFAGVADTNVSAVGFTWLTYLGGSTADAVAHVVSDSVGDLFATGDAFSSDFPVTTGAFQTTLKNTSGGPNAFVTELDPTGLNLVYSSYLGGTGDDVGFGINLDSAGDAYVTGQTSSTDFPLANPIQSTNLAPGNGATNAFVTEMNPTGSGLVFSTYLGGSSNPNSVNNGDTGWGIAVDMNNDIYVAGTTGSGTPGPGEFPLVNAFQNGFGGVDDGFLTKISAASNTGNVTVTPTSLSFVSTAVGMATAAQPATLMNGTTASVTVSSVVIAVQIGGANDFTQTNNCTTLAAGASCTINVVYTPSTASTETATLTITDNGSGSPQIVSLTGQVGSFTLSASPGSLTLTAGQSGTFVVTVTPSGSFSLPVALACTGAPSAATCSVSPATVTPNGAPVTATATVNTTARSLMAPPPSSSSRPGPGLPAGTLALAALLGIGFLYTKRLPGLGQARYARASVLALIAMLLLVGGMTACNGSGTSGGGGTPAGTYTLTVTGTSGNLMPTTTVTLNVQ
jgi:hypothetical protein